jgi:hypothetical protein
MSDRMTDIINHVIFAVCAVGILIGAGMFGYKCDQATKSASQRLVALAE